MRYQEEGQLQQRHADGEQAEPGAVIENMDPGHAPQVMVDKEARQELVVAEVVAAVGQQCPEPVSLMPEEG